LVSDAVVHLLAGPNGAGKTTLVRHVIAPVTHLPFVNADELAALHWPGSELEHGHEASQLARHVREQMLANRKSFITETVFSHPSKLQLVRDARSSGFRVTLHVVMIPEELAVARVRERVRNNGHDVPEEKVRERFRRLWPLVAEAIAIADESFVYDNTSAGKPHRLIATFLTGRISGKADWPAWAPQALQALTR
jgi:predicted ABC-type ATPase